MSSNWETFRVGSTMHSFNMPDAPLDRLVCREILDGKAYPILPLKYDVQTIVDIGANAGAAAMWFHGHYPKAKVYAYEPDPRAFNRLVTNFSGRPNVQTFNIGIHQFDGEGRLYHGKQGSVTNSVFPNPALTDEQFTVCTFRKPSSIHADYLPMPPDILKLDVEGAEIAILRELKPHLAKIGVIYVEYHSDLDRDVIGRDVIGFNIAHTSPEPHPRNRTHLLWWSRAELPHRGTLVFVRLDLVPEHLTQLEIRSR